MRKTHIALLVAVVSSPLALADSYYNPYDPYGGNDKTVSDSFNKTVDKHFTETYDKNVDIKDSYNEDNDKLIMRNVNNTDKHEFIDNSTHDYSKDLHLSIEDNYNMAQSSLDGAVTYSEVSYGSGDCCGGGHGYGGYGGYGPQAPSSLTVNHHNDMSGAFAGASGINIAGQNAGNNSLVQQSASTNAMLGGN